MTEGMMGNGSPAQVIATLHVVLYSDGRVEVSAPNDEAACVRLLWATSRAIHEMVKAPPNRIVAPG